MTYPEPVGRWANRIGIAGGPFDLPQHVMLEDVRILNLAVDAYWHRRMRPMTGERPNAREVGVVEVAA